MTSLRKFAALPVRRRRKRAFRLIILLQQNDFQVDPLSNENARIFLSVQALFENNELKLLKL